MTAPHTHQSTAMPDPLDLPALVQKYKERNTADARALLAHDLLRGDWDGLLISGDALVLLLALNEDDIRPADTDIDSGWGGLYAVVAGIERMCTQRGPTALTDAERAYARLAAALRRWIGDNLKFLLLAPSEEWRESELRLKRVDEPIAEGIETPRQAAHALGLGWAIDRLLRLHRTYGLVLGLGLDPDTTSALSQFADKLDHFLSGVRYNHKNDPKAHDLFIAPFEEALATSRERRRKIQAQRRAKKAAQSTPSPA